MLVELRMRRQERLTQPGFEGLTAVMAEAALHHQMGSRAVMRSQLEKLCQVTEEGTAATHVLRFDAGPWPGIGDFVIYGFREHDESEIVLVDGDLGAAVHEDREPISALTYTFHAALAKALSVRESLDLYQALLREL